jgi:hypothetical protein
MPQARDVEPRTFFLNEQHELTRDEKGGGGRLPLYVNINWGTKGPKLARSLRSVERVLSESEDPISKDRFFILAKPPRTVSKSSKDKSKAPQGTFEEKVNYAGDDSLVLGRLGLDLIQVHSDGRAIIHARPERVQQLINNATELGRAGAREQARWAKVEQFDLIPWNFKLDETWLASLQSEKPAEVLIELQPLLNRLEADVVLRKVAESLDQRRGEAFRTTGADFSGRQWFRGNLTPKTVRRVAETFSSVQALHPPLISHVLSPRAVDLHEDVQPRVAHARVDVRSLPSVAIVDTGIPADHLLLSPYRRGQYIDPDSFGVAVGDHGSFVASRAVFGDVSTLPHELPQPGCAFYDALISTNATDIDDKNVARALGAVVGTSPDVRVFNLSFDGPPIEQLDEVIRSQRLILVQDLDNFIFASDVLVVVAAGNTRAGVIPNPNYPQHFADPAWKMGHWARSFNSLTCGAIVGSLNPDGLVTNVGWPSPFSRLGPGLAESPKPDFAESGGNTTQQYAFSPGLGVWGTTAAGIWEDRVGTSYSAPLLAREAARAFQVLQGYCQQGARPFACLVKAYLALTARRVTVPEPLKELAEYALGYGRPSAARLLNPLGSSAVFVWQGVIENAEEVVRVQMPIPISWFRQAKNPILKILVACDSPVNAAATDVWATRQINVYLRAQPDARAHRAARAGHISYPLTERVYRLNRVPTGVRVTSDLWVIELSYEQIAEYFPGIDFSPQQRVAFAAELFDAGEAPVSPQPAVQSLSIASSLQRLSVPAARLRTPVILRTRI